MLPRMRRVLTIVPLHAPRLPSVSVCSPDLHSPQSGAPFCLFPQSRHTQIGPEAEADETKQQTLSCLKVTASRVSSLGPSAGSVAASGLDLEADIQLPAQPLAEVPFVQPRVITQPARLQGNAMRSNFTAPQMTSNPVHSCEPERVNNPETFSRLTSKADSISYMASQG
ncbi:hypothetical protein SNOG_06704 [Parastagonospora nodorum SN15]|uniref:Uncharacterized protein n=1 Tax=Phaeosphaeria nodorum (strain SN15 / ATCC MYA-4574 / FGSC 10173) TaxID=321614 RepID=Q0UNG0_PHANO|nr:hypothetical protein SNOG_06704 [Parastagonospora nodorum SN15]EAT85355.1 hypothetical protein SNOG_06704 [Parastagonospora nodorum SN15]